MTVRHLPFLFAFGAAHFAGCLLLQETGLVLLSLPSVCILRPSLPCLYSPPDPATLFVTTTFTSNFGASVSCRSCGENEEFARLARLKHNVPLTGLRLESTCLVQLSIKPGASADLSLMARLFSPSNLKSERARLTISVSSAFFSSLNKLPDHLRNWATSQHHGTTLRFPPSLLRGVWIPLCCVIGIGGWTLRLLTMPSRYKRSSTYAPSIRSKVSPITITPRSPLACYSKHFSAVSRRALPSMAILSHADPSYILQSTGRVVSASS